MLKLNDLRVGYKSYKKVTKSLRVLTCSVTKVVTKVFVCWFLREILIVIIWRQDDHDSERASDQAGCPRQDVRDEERSQDIYLILISIQPGFFCCVITYDGCCYNQ